MVKYNAKWLLVLHDHCKRHVHTLVVDDVDSDSATLKMLFFIIDKFSHSSSKCLH